MTHAYVVEAVMQYDGSSVIGVATSLTKARQIGQEHAGTKLNWTRNGGNYWMSQYGAGRLVVDECVVVSKHKIL